MLQRLVARLRPPDVEGLFAGAALAVTLTAIAEAMLAAALTDDAIALHRLILAEAHRFPELAAITRRIGAREEAVARIAALLQRTPATRVAPKAARFAAEQFLQMVIAVPQRRALGLGKPMRAAERTAWARDTVQLFLAGFGRPR